MLTSNTTLIAIDRCYLKGTGRATLTIGKHYPIVDLYPNEICVIDDEGDQHYFGFDKNNEAEYYLNFFKTQ